MISPTGDIKDMTVPWLLQDIRVQSKTGVAVFEYIQGQMTEKAVKQVYFKNGDIIFASSSLHADRLGDYLLRENKITQVQLDATTEIIQKTGKKQGAILIDLGFIAPQDLVGSVKKHVKQIIMSLFSIKMGTYHFNEGPLPMADIIPLQMSTGDVIIDGIRDIDWKGVRKSLPPMKTILRPAIEPSNLFQSVHLDQDQRAVFALIDGSKSIMEICNQSGIGDFNTLKAIFVLLSLRMVDIGAIESEEDKRFVREVVREAVTERKIEKKAEPTVVRPDEPEVIVTREMIQTAFNALRGQNHYEVLGVAINAPVPDIRHAYFRLAKQYHPDLHFDPAMSDMKQILETLFDRIHKAYAALSDHAKRAEYDLTVSQIKAQAKKAPEKAPETKSPDADEQGPENDIQENYKEKSERALQQFNNGMKEFKVGNYWGAVEAFSWATRLDPIKAQYFYYFGLCLSHIPRRKHEAEENLRKAIELDPTKADYHIELSDLYIKSSLKLKALNVLNNALGHLPGSPRILEAIMAAEGRASTAAAEEKKTSAVRKPSQEEPDEEEFQRPDSAKAKQALEQYNKGMKEFKIGNYSVAADAFAQAIRLDSRKAVYHYYHGLTVSRIPRRLQEAEDNFRKAVDLDRTKLEYHMELSNFYVRSDLKAKAQGVLNNARIYFPDAQKIKDALKAVGGAVVEAAPEEKKSGIFGKIFGGKK